MVLPPISILPSSDPIAIVNNKEGDIDAWAQGKAAVLGHELELANILKFIKNKASRTCLSSLLTCIFQLS